MLMLKSTHEAIVAKKLDEQAQLIRKLTDERDQLSDDLHDERMKPWPNWLDDMKAQIRAVSGYDGYDDAIEGIDLPEELRELIDVLTEEASKNTINAREDRKMAELESTADHYRKQAADYRTRLAVFTAPRKRGLGGRFVSSKGGVA